MPNYHFRVCIKDGVGYDGQRDIVHVDYLVVGGNLGGKYSSITVVRLYICRTICLLHDLVYIWFFHKLVSHEITRKYFSHCVFILDLDPRRNVTCHYESHCVPLAPHQFSCRCEDSCPSYEEQVCASNGRTFTNLCLLKQEICLTRANYTQYHPGSCTGIIIVIISSISITFSVLVVLVVLLVPSIV